MQPPTARAGDGVPGTDGGCGRGWELGRHGTSWAFWEGGGFRELAAAGACRLGCLLPQAGRLSGRAAWHVWRKMDGQNR